jgi:UDP-N-acetylmuramate dehydrogenase
MKGRCLGGAEISPLHANFIANRGGATAADVLGLIDEARAAVWRASGVRLVPEVRILGGKP